MQDTSKDSLCADCARPKNDINFHFDAPGAHEASGLHWFKKATCSPDSDPAGACLAMNDLACPVHGEFRRKEKGMAESDETNFYKTDQKLEAILGPLKPAALNKAGDKQ